MKMVMVLAMLACSSLSLPARTWRNAEGREIEAEFVSSDGKTVRLKMETREVDYPIANLSEEDRQWIARQEERKTEPAPVTTGLRTGVPITSRLYPEIDDYFDEKSRKEVLKAFEDGAYAIEGKDDPDSWFKRDAADSCVIYVPNSYDGSEPYGLYLHISPGDDGRLPSEWFPLFDERKMIAVSANGTSNHQPMLRRVMLSMDAVQTVGETYTIDPKRRFSGGLSGGGHMGMLTAAMFPEHFVGAISHAAQSYLPHDDGFGHFPGMTLKDFNRSPRRDLGWVVIGGNKDSNYPEILKTTEAWEGTRLHYRFIDVPEMAHVTASAEKLGEAFDWILTQAR